MRQTNTLLCNPAVAPELVRLRVVEGVVSFAGGIGMRGWLARAFGNRGERRAARYLRGLGYTIIARQHTNRYGEVDIIARDGDCLVFVEVKTRKSTAAGHPAEAVDRTKQGQLTRVALAYLKQHGLLEARSRFDVIAIIWPEEGRRPELQHFQNAFPPVGTGQMFS